jgi:hypothetical protein
MYLRQEFKFLSLYFFHSACFSFDKRLALSFVNKNSGELCVDALPISCLLITNGYQSNDYNVLDVILI